MFTALVDGWVELGLTEGKITVYMNVTQKKNTRIDISSGELSSLVFSLRLFNFYLEVLFGLFVFDRCFVSLLNFSACVSSQVQV